MAGRNYNVRVFIIDYLPSSTSVLADSTSNATTGKTDLGKNRLNWGVTYFDKNEISSGVQTMTLEKFTGTFAKKLDTLNVEDWLKRIVNNENHDDSYLAEIKVSNGKTKKNSKKNENTVYSRLTVTGVNREDHLIHLESRLTAYSSQQSVIRFRFPWSARKQRKTMVGQNLASTFLSLGSYIPIAPRFLLKNMNVAENFLNSRDPDLMMAILYIRLYPNSPLNSLTINQFQAIGTEVLRRGVSTFLSKDRRFTSLLNDPSMNFTAGVLVCRACTTNLWAVDLATYLQTEIQKGINSSLKKEDIKIAIGIFCDYHYTSYVNGMKNATSMADAIQNRFSTEGILVYDPKFYDKFKKNTDDVQAETMVVKNAAFRFYFTTAFNLTRRTEELYFLRVTSRSNPKEGDIDSDLKLCRQADAANHPEGTPPGESSDPSSILLFTEIRKQMEKIQGNARRPLTVAFTIPFSFLDAFFEANPQNGQNDITWIITLEEASLATTLDNPAKIKLTLRNAIDKGYKLAIRLARTEPMLPSSVLQSAAYFIIGGKFTAHLEAQGVNVVNLIENNYKSYEGRRIYCDINSNDSLENCVFNGARIVSGRSMLDESSLPEKVDLTQRYMELKKLDELVAGPYAEADPNAMKEN